MGALSGKGAVGGGGFASVCCYGKSVGNNIKNCVDICVIQYLYFYRRFTRIKNSINCSVIESVAISWIGGDCFNNALKTRM